MPDYYVEITVRSIGMDSEGAFDNAADDIAAALFALDDGRGARFAATPRGRTLTFGYLFHAITKQGALRKALAVTRTALHASGGATPDWPDDFPVIDKSAIPKRDLIPA